MSETMTSAVSRQPHAPGSMLSSGDITAVDRGTPVGSDAGLQRPAVFDGVLPLLDPATRLWWRSVGRPIDVRGEHSWLDAPISGGSLVAGSWVDHLESLRPRPAADAGLIPSFDALAGPDFDPQRVAPAVREFYEHTSQWHMDVWSQWAPWSQPGGAMISGLFGRRVQQLALPVQPLATSRGMASVVTPLVDADGEQAAAAWVRTLKSTGETVFSGCYRIGRVPAEAQPLVHVAFPLEKGSVQVFLRPTAHRDGSFSLISAPGRFGDPGAYVVVTVRGRHHAAKVPLHERFHLFVDDDGVLRTDHTLKLGRATVVRLHYRLSRLSDG